MAAIDHALARIRQDGSHLLRSDSVNQLSRQLGLPFRETLLTPGNTLRLFVQQVAHGNIACNAVRHLSDQPFTDSAWCQARERLSIELLRGVHQRLLQEARRELDCCNDIGDGTYRWHEHRVYVVDGSSDSMPDTPELREHYGVPAGCREGLGFPTSSLLLTFDHRSGLLIDCVDSPLYTGDVANTPSAHAQLHEGDVLLGDDAFAGWAHLALILQAKLHAVTPIHHRRLVNFTPQIPSAQPRSDNSARRAGRAPRAAKLSSRVLRTLGKEDQLVEYFKPAKKPPWLSEAQWAQLPQSITVREIRRTVKRNGFRPITVDIVTTLLDADQYPADELIELRLSRWMVELNLRHLKTTLGMNVLKCKSLEGIRKERLVFLLVYNLIRILMLGAAQRQQVNVNRLSFADTLAWLRWGDLTSPPEFKINPVRSGRLEPRVIKRQKKEYPYMTRPRAELKSQLRASYGDTS
jgi:hypothetical protein